jgi:hypothetical protein
MLPVVESESTGTAQSTAGGHGKSPQARAAARGVAVLALLGIATLAMIALWAVLMLQDESAGFGFAWANFPDWLVVGLFVTHLVTAPAAWITAVVVLVTAGRRMAGVFGIAVVPVATFVSLLVAMTDAWAWHTAAAQASGLGSYLIAVALVAAGPLSLLALMAAASYERLRTTETPA